MAVAAKERARYRPKWAELAHQALRVCAGGDGATLKALAGEAGRWVLPTDELADSLACMSLTAAARAYCAQRQVGRRHAVGTALHALAHLVIEVLEASAPPPAPPPFRADLDG